jgi:hypothetical protein
MFRVQRAGVGRQAAWQTICTHANEAHAREVYQRQLKLHSSGRFRLVNAQDRVLAEAKAQPLFHRSERDDEERGPTYYAPAAESPRPG